jgi:hypothetical protein
MRYNEYVDYQKKVEICPNNHEVGLLYLYEPSQPRYLMTLGTGMRVGTQR